MLLALEATDRSGSLALAEDGEILEMTYERSKVTHSERLMPELDRLLDKRSAEYSDITSIAVARGPGSFTAIRLAVTTAKTLALNLDIDLVAPSTLRVMAEYAPPERSFVTTALDARRGEVYTQDFRRKNNRLKPVDEPTLMSPEALRDHCGKRENPMLVFRGRDLSPEFETWPDSVDVYPEELLSPFAAALVRLSTSTNSEKFVSGADEVAPLYVRKSDAQRSQSKDGAAT